MRKSRLFVQIHKAVGFDKEKIIVLRIFNRTNIFEFLQKNVETHGIVWYSKEEIRLKFVILHFLTSDLPKNVILHFLQKW